MIETRLTDETIKLYGFFSAEERAPVPSVANGSECRRAVALAVLSTLSPRELERALALGDKAVVGRSPGVKGQNWPCALSPS